MGKHMDHAWDTEDGDAFELKLEEWEGRNWTKWLAANLSFPFTAKREDDNGEAFDEGLDDQKPFQLGHKMKVLRVEPDEYYVVGLRVQAQDGKHNGFIPLADLEVTPKSDKNFWPVREYAVWFANRM